jgi:hypothetical protein
MYRTGWDSEHGGWYFITSAACRHIDLSLAYAIWTGCVPPSRAEGCGSAQRPSDELLEAIDACRVI